MYINEEHIISKDTRACIFSHVLYIAYLCFHYPNSFFARTNYFNALDLVLHMPMSSVFGAAASSEPVRTAPEELVLLCQTSRQIRIGGNRPVRTRLYILAAALYFLYATIASFLVFSPSAC